MRKILFILIAGLCLSACTELDNIEFLNLKRDNPLDEMNNSNLKGGVALKFDSYKIVYDNNNDDIINKGETVYLFVNIKNNGSKTANKVKATFSTTSSYVSGLTPSSQVDYGDISASSTQGYNYGGYGSTPNYDSYTLKFTVSNATPDNSLIPINITLTDENGNTWNNSFEVSVEKIGADIGYYNHKVIYDNNNDDIVNKGETVYLTVNLRNNGSSSANKVKATFSTTSSYVSGLTPISQVDYGNISAGSTQGYSYGNYGSTPNYDSYTIKFTVLNTTPVNTKIPININITDENGNTWISSFDVTVEAIGANIGYYSHKVIYDNNNNNIINKGETVYLFVNLRNSGSSTANKVQASFSTTSSYVSGFTPATQIDYGNILAGSTQSYNYGDYGSTPNYDSYTIKFTVSSNTPTNTQIPINISLVDESSNTWTSSFNVTVQ